VHLRLRRHRVQSPKNLFLPQDTPALHYHRTPSDTQNNRRAADFSAVLSIADFLWIPREAWPKALSVPRAARMGLRTPEVVHETLHADYACDPNHR
jgi:hypothetical protein